MKNIRAFFARFKSKKFRRFFAGVTLLVIFLIGLFVYQEKVGRVEIDNSLIYAPISQIAPDSPGILKRVYVYEGENVKQGDPIADIGNATIHAQSDGLVVKVNNALGTNISSLNPVAGVLDPNDLRVDGTIDENKGLSDIKVGQVVSFSVDALPGQTFWGFVDEVSPTAKTTALSFSISSERPTQQFDIYAKFNALNNPEIKNGMSAKMTVYTKAP